MKNKQDKPFLGYRMGEISLLIIWTGILLWAATQHYYFSEMLEEKVTEIIIQHAVSNTVAFDYAQKEENTTDFAKKIISQTNTLEYVVENLDALPQEQGKNFVKAASYFSGNQAKEVFWSAAASKKEREKKLFQKSDNKIAVLTEKEKKEEQQKEQQQEQGEQEKAEKQKEQEQEFLAQQENEEKNATVTAKNIEQTITVFNNGSSDITAANRTDDSAKKERNHLEKIHSDSKEKLENNRKMIAKLKKSNSRSYLLKKFYITDSSTSIDNKIFQVNELLQMNLKIKKKKQPQILILHTHGASEGFVDSRKGKEEDTIVGVGECLAQILSEKYGYQVIHDKTKYDKIGGSIDRNKAYNNASQGLKKTLQKYPSIQVVIDLHRDGVGKKVNRTTIVDGKKTAQVMFFNGLSRNASGDIAYLHNANLQGNLAFSLQLKLSGMQHFENLVRPVYLKGYRYNMHLRKRYTLIELGNENNTLEEAKNAAAPIALMLNEVLSGK